MECQHRWWRWWASGQRNKSCLHLLGTQDEVEGQGQEGKIRKKKADTSQVRASFDSLENELGLKKKVAGELCAAGLAAVFGQGSTSTPFLQHRLN